MGTRFAIIIDKKSPLNNTSVYIIGQNSASSLCLTYDGEEIRIQNKNLQSIKEKYILRLINSDLK